MPLLQVVQRVSLRQLMPNVRAVVCNLFKTLEIREPAFKNVVILYRRAVSDKKKSDYDPVRDVDKVPFFFLAQNTDVCGVHKTGISSRYCRPGALRCM